MTTKVLDSQSATVGDPVPSMPEAPLGEQSCATGTNFEIGAQVTCREGRCGRLTKVVVDPITENVTGLVVERGFLLKTDRVVPVAAVDRVAGGEVHLGVGIQELNGFEPYEDVVFRVPAAGWNSAKYEPQDLRIAMSPYEGVGGQSVAPSRQHHLHKGVAFGAAVIGHGTKVHCKNGGVGIVDHVLVGCEEDHITHLIVKRKMAGEYHIVPVEVIEQVDDDGVRLSLTREQVRALPAYRPR